MTVLLERESELAVVEGLLAAARAGAGAVLAIEGTAGMGKTRLLREIRERADGLEVLAARGGELESDMPFGVVRQLFEVVLARHTPQVRATLLSGAAAPAVRLLDIVGDVETASELSDQFQMLHALYWLLANMSESRPQVLVVDDAHLADQPSLRFVRYLLPRLPELPVLVVLAARPTDAVTAGLVLAEILADQVTRVERLAPLSEAAAATVVVDALGRDTHPQFAQACHQVSGGNPFLLSELVRELADRGMMPSAATAARIESITPPAVTRAVMLRLARLPDAARSVARALAVLEAGRLRHVAALADLDLDTAAKGADALYEAGIIDSGATLRFTHPLIRTAVYTDLPLWQRARTHRAAGRLMAQDDRSPDEAAAHLLLTDPDADPATVDLLRRAASAASTRGAPDVAARYLSRALAEPPSDESRTAVLFDLGIALASLGDERGIDHLMESVRSTSDPQERAQRTLALTDFLVIAGRFPDAVESLEQAACLSADPELSFALRVRQASRGRLDARTYPQLGANLRQLLHQATANDGPAVRELLVYSAFDALQTTSAGEANDLLGRALTPPGLMTFHVCESMVAGVALATLIYLERFDEFDTLIVAGLVDVRRRNSVLGFLSISLFRALGDMRRGRLQEVEAGAAAALRGVPMEAWRFDGPSLLGLLVSARVERGDLRGAERALESVRSLDERVSLAYVLIRLNRGRLRLARGDTANALRDFLKAGEQMEANAVHSPAFDSWRCLAARAYLRLGKREEAVRIAEQDLVAARRLAGPAAQGVALYTLGMAVGGDGGIDLLHQAVATLRSSYARLDLAYALVELGAALRRSNRRIESRDPLRHGLELADGLGAAPLADRAKAELAATGVRPRHIVFSGADALTASERRVAELAATGMSNRDIAQALFVTTKTVEKHLGGTYLKLGITSRTQLVEQLGEPR